MKYAIVLFCLLLFSCKGNDKKTISAILEHWEHREILFPANPIFTIQGKDTICYSMKGKFKILSYIDSIGCTSCKLRLDEWKMFISHLDSLFEPNFIRFMFFFTPKNQNDIYRILAYNKFTYPVCIDELDSINKINRLPSEMIYQTFLLDDENKVIAVGNPIYNPKIRNLYLNIMLGRNNIKEIESSQTIVDFSEFSINMKDFDWREKQEKEITMFNTGDFPFVITNITTSCGCILAEYNNEPIMPHKKGTLKIIYKADHPEYFNKTINVYCNAKGSPFQLKISGNAK